MHGLDLTSKKQQVQDHIPPYIVLGNRRFNTEDRISVILLFSCVVTVLLIDLLFDENGA